MGGGFCVLFSFPFIYLASRFSFALNDLSNLVLVVFAKQCVDKWFVVFVNKLAPKQNQLSLSFFHALAGHLKAYGAHLVPFLLLSFMLS